MLHFHSWQNFFHMGGYAWCVWSAYGIVFLLFGLFSLNSNLKLKRALNQNAPVDTHTLNLNLLDAYAHKT